MFEIIGALGPVFLLILLGAGLKRIGFPKAEFWPLLEQLVYYLLFPAMLISKLAHAEVDGSALPSIAASTLLMLLIGSAMLVILKPFIASTGPAFTSVFQGGIRFNTYIGFAGVAALYGDQGLIIAAIAVAILIPIVNLFCVSSFFITLHSDNFSWKRFLGSLVRNPLILGCVMGIALNQTGIGLTSWLADTLSLLGAAALPLGLLAVGVGLDISTLGSAKRELISSSVARFLLLPVIMLAALLWLEPPSLQAQVLLLLAALPTATSSYILARQMGGDHVLMANIITLQTLLGFVLLPAWVLVGEKLF
jgi:malonate transporter